MSNKPIRRIAIIGTGVIGASWTSLYLAKGLEVTATDVAPNAEAALRRFVEAAWPALKRLGLAPGASQSNLKFTAALAEAVKGADHLLSIVRPVLIIEIHPPQLTLSGGSEDELFQLLRKHRYDFEVIDRNPNSLYTIVAKPQ